MLLTRAPVAARKGRSLPRAAPRLACVKPAASVHPEPGSNSPLLYLVFFFASVCPASRFQFSKGSTETSISLPCFTLLPTSPPKPRSPPLIRDGRRNTGSMSLSCGIISLSSSLPRRPAASRQRLQNYHRLHPRCKHPRHGDPETPLFRHPMH